VTSFHNKAGGSFTLRFTTYQSFGVSDDDKAQYQINKDQKNRKRIMIRESLNAGEISNTRFYTTGQQPYLNQFESLQPLYLYQNGLPVPKADFLFGRSTLMLAPVSGDYYILIDPQGSSYPNQTTHIWVDKTVPQIISSNQTAIKAQTDPYGSAVFQIKMKKFDFLSAQVSGPNKSFDLSAITKPDVAGFDLSDPTKNPFFPGVTPNPDLSKLTIMPARPGDPRFLDFYAMADQTVWVGLDSSEDKPRNYDLTMKPAAVMLPANGTSHQKLQIGWTNYALVPLNQGDIMTLALSAEGFRPRIHIFNSDLNTESDDSLPLDVYSQKSEIDSYRNENYIVAVSCVGDGGQGDFSLSSIVHPAKTFSLSNPGAGSIEANQIQVWKFTLSASEPVIFHWHTTDPATTFNLTSFSENVYAPVQVIDSNNSIAILNPDKEVTFTMVIRGGNNNANYTMSLEPIPHNQAATGKPSPKLAAAKGPHKRK